MRVLPLCALIAACGAGKAGAPRPEGPAAPTAREPGAEGERGTAGDDAPATEAGTAPAAPVTEECRRAYDGYIAAWAAWFDAELEDSEAQAALIAEFGQELPLTSALDEMREVADELKYEAGFDLWFRALTATERAIARCGEGAPRPP